VSVVEEVRVSRRPPVPALLAVASAVLSALAVAFFGAVALVFPDDPGSDDGAWLFVAAPAVLSLLLLVGAFFLLTGRSWVAVALPAVALTLVVVWGVLDGTLGDGTGAPLVLVWALPLVTALLAVLRGVRLWVAGRRLARLTSS